MSALKSVLSVVVGIVSVAGMMAIILLCPLAFIKLARRGARPSEQSEADASPVAGLMSWRNLGQASNSMAASL